MEGYVCVSRFVQCPFGTHQTELAAKQLEHNNLVNAFNILCLNFIYTIVGWAAAAAVMVVSVTIDGREGDKKKSKTLYNAFERRNIEA